MNKQEGFYAEEDPKKTYKEYVERREEVLNPSEVSQKKIENAVLSIRATLDELRHQIQGTNQAVTPEMLTEHPQKWEKGIAYAAESLSTAIKKEKGDELNPFWDYNVLYDQLLPQVTNPLEREILIRARGILTGTTATSK